MPKSAPRPTPAQGSKPNAWFPTRKNADGRSAGIRRDISKSGVERLRFLFACLHCSTTSGSWPILWPLPLRLEENRHEAGLLLPVVGWLALSVRRERGCHLLAPPIARISEASEAEQHHRPCGRFGNCRCPQRVGASPQKFPLAPVSGGPDVAAPVVGSSVSTETDGISAPPYRTPSSSTIAPSSTSPPKGQISVAMPVVVLIV